DGKTMKKTAALISLLACAIALCALSVTSSVAQQRVALVIGNSNYETGPLVNPANDASDMASALRKLGFTVILKKDANLEIMEEAMEDFGNRLKKGGVGLFFYAGHGVQVYGSNYLIPVGAKIKKESDIKYRAVDAARILDEMDNAGNGMNIVILDACRDNPFGRSFRSASRGLSIISTAPRGTYITYSTSPGNVAADGKGRNSPYTESLLNHINTPGLPIEQVFKQVRQDLTRKTGGRQVPWELSSLSGDFYFNASGIRIKKEQGTQSGVKSTDDDLAEERRKLAEERERLRKEEELLKEKNALAETRRKMEEERRKVEAEKQKIASLPKVDAAGGTRTIDLLNARVSEVKFFESAYDAPDKDKRIYRTSFSRTTSRYICWELNLTHPAAGVRKNFTVEHLWFNPYGNEIFRGSFNSYIAGDWTYSYHNSGYGWREVSTKTWVAGTYRVDLYVEGSKIASESFSVY
ncbi:MAG TPA: caspase domain-containing protein, partial [Smithellaceae bacterium]|nr:caspase domain-containing protein [Smithellaceae bacterium]